ncbi:hypothetical protein EK21DRAFT_38043, partial [Setomelanomma holmii]
TPPRRLRLPTYAQSFSSKLDQSNTPLRTTSDGKLIDEDTGDWLVLDTPPHDSEDREIAWKNKKVTRGPLIGLPESKNGATGLDDPRARKPLARLLRNKWHGFDRLPAHEEDPEILERKKLRAEIMQYLRQENLRVPKVDMRLLSEVQKYYTAPLGQKIGGDWFEHAL